MKPTTRIDVLARADWRYQMSTSTDIAVTFRRVRRERAEQKCSVSAETIERIQKVRNLG